MKNENFIKALNEVEEKNIDELTNQENEPKLSERKTKEILEAIENGAKKQDEASKQKLPTRKASRLLRKLPVAIILIVLLTSTLILFSGAFFDKGNSNANSNEDFVPLFDNNPYYIFESVLGPTLVNMDECSVTVIDEIPEVYKDSRFYGPFHFYSNTIALAVRSRDLLSYTFYAYNIETGEVTDFGYTADQNARNTVVGYKNKFYTVDGKNSDNGEDTLTILEFNISDGSVKPVLSLQKKPKPENIKWTRADFPLPFAADENHIYAYVDYDGIYKIKLDGSGTKKIYDGFVYSPELCANGYIYFQSMDMEQRFLTKERVNNMDVYRIPANGGERELFYAPDPFVYCDPLINRETGFVYYRNIKKGDEFTAGTMYSSDDIYVVRKPGEIELVCEIPDDIFIYYVDIRTHGDYVIGQYRTRTPASEIPKKEERESEYRKMIQDPDKPIEYVYSDPYPELIIVNGNTGEIEKINTAE